MIKYLFIIILSLFSLSSTSQTDTVTVTYVVDGDTFYGRSSRGERIKYRPIGFDTPEKSYSGKPAEPYNEEATAHFKSLIDGQKVIVKYGIQQKDRYQRSLVYVYLMDGTFVNAEMLKAGWAEVMSIPPNVEHIEELRLAYREGREKGRGMWQ